MGKVSEALAVFVACVLGGLAAVVFAAILVVVAAIPLTLIGCIFYGIIMFFRAG